MDEISIILLSLLLGLASGFIGGIATGGGLLAIPVLMFMGLPPSSAIATNNLGGASSITSAFRYHQSKLIHRRYFLPFLLATTLGSFAGSILLLNINELIVQKIFGMACIGLAIIIALNKTIAPRDRGALFYFAGLLSIFLASAFAGLFGTGGGIFTVYILSFFYGMTTIEANANSKLASIGGILSVIIVFLNAGLINFSYGIPLMIGSAIGGYIGAHTAIKKGDAKVRLIFLLIVTIAGIKLILS